MKNIHTMKQRVQKGFTLIELMIVVAIIGILAALAIPAYQDYTIKSRVGEGASVAGSWKTAMEVYWSEKGNLTDAFLNGNILGDEDLGLSPSASPYVSSIGITGTATLPRITIKLRTLNDLGTASGQCYQYVPYLSTAASNNLSWAVAGDATASVDVPAGTPVEVDKATAVSTGHVGSTTGLNNIDCGNGFIATKYKPKR